MPTPARGFREKAETSSAFSPPSSVASPIVKWVGGKGRLLSQLVPLLPRGVNRMRHVEPFFGGGAMFFARGPERALLTDINSALIETYEVVRDEPEAVIESLRGLAHKHDADEYYRVRARYNARRSGNVSNAAMFIYLNKTCFNGLHRVNRNGHFNVPAGRYTNPRIVDEDGLRMASEILKRAELSCAGFEALLERARPGDFIYFDPPYEPVSSTANFTAYARDGFTAQDQARLREVYVALDRRGCKLMLSNSSAPLIFELYGSYQIDSVAAPRAVNCDPSKRGRVTELVVRNYG